MNLPEITSFCEHLAMQAGKSIMEIYKNNFEVETKLDNSPLTLADKAANDIIVAALSKQYPNCAILSEESQDNPDRLSNDYCFIVDPLDGTKEFVSRNGQFTVNIALCYKGKSVVGVIYVPVTGELFSAYESGGAYYSKPGEVKMPIRVSNSLDNLVFVGSRSHLGKHEEILLKEKDDIIAKTVSIGSSLKGCMIAQGIADVYYRSGLTCEWDTAAMQCIVEEADGIFRQMDGSEMRYNRKNTLNEKGFFVVNRAENIWV